MKTDILDQVSERDLLGSLKEAVEGLKSLERILVDTNPCRYCNFNPRFPEKDEPYHTDEFYKGLNDIIAKAEKQQKDIAK